MKARKDGAMQKPALGILHPGKMGISVAAAAQHSGCEVYWVSCCRGGYLPPHSAFQGCRVNAAT